MDFVKDFLSGNCICVIINNHCYIIFRNIEADKKLQLDLIG